MTQKIGLLNIKSYSYNNNPDINKFKKSYLDFGEYILNDNSIFKGIPYIHMKNNKLDFDTILSNHYLPFLYENELYLIKNHLINNL